MLRQIDLIFKQIPLTDKMLIENKAKYVLFNVTYRAIVGWAVLQKAKGWVE